MIRFLGDDRGGVSVAPVTFAQVVCPSVVEKFSWFVSSRWKNLAFSFLSRGLFLLSWVQKQSTAHTMSKKLNWNNHTSSLVSVLLLEPSDSRTSATSPTFSPSSLSSELVLLVMLHVDLLFAGRAEGKNSHWALQSQLYFWDCKQADWLCEPEESQHRG